MDKRDDDTYFHDHYENGRESSDVLVAAPPVSRPRGDHRERREAIAAAAAQLIATRGLEQVTLRSVAAEGPPGMERLHAVVTAVLPVDRDRRTLWRLLMAFLGNAVATPALRRVQERRMGRWYDLYPLYVGSAA